MSDAILDFYVGDTIRVNFYDMTHTGSDGVTRALGAAGAPSLTDAGVKIVATCSVKPGTTFAWQKKNSANGGDETQISVTAADSLIVYATNAESAVMTAKKYTLDLVVLFPDNARPTLGYVTLNMMWRPTQGNIPV